jgi:hypothetical protein
MNKEDFEKSMEEIERILQNRSVIDTMLSLCKLCNRYTELYKLGILYASPELLDDIPEFVNKTNAKIDKMLKDSARE